MRAAQYLGPGRIEAVEVARPDIGRGEALLSVEACGMCGSDLFILSGSHPRAKAPLTIGHEFCGRIVELDSGTNELREGDRVAAFPLISCGQCLMCRTGNVARVPAAQALRNRCAGRNGGVREAAVEQSGTGRRNESEDRRIDRTAGGRGPWSSAGAFEGGEDRGRNRSRTDRTVNRAG